MVLLPMPKRLPLPDGSAILMLGALEVAVGDWDGVGVTAGVVVVGGGAVVVVGGGWVAGAVVGGDDEHAAISSAARIRLNTMIHLVEVKIVFIFCSLF